MKVIISLLFVLLIILLFSKYDYYSNENFENICNITHPLEDEKKAYTTQYDGEIGNCPVNGSGYPKTKCFSCENQSVRMYGTPRYGVNTKSFDAEETSKQVYGTYKYGQTSSCFDCE